jgi:flagellar hook-associated protein 2
MTTANVLTSLGAADLDTKQLVTDLVNAVKEPRQKQIDTNKTKAEVAVSSLGLLKSALSNLQAAATELGSVGKLNKLSISNSNSGVVVAEAGSTAVALPGNHSIKVTTLAQPKRIASGGFASNSTVPNPSAYDIKLYKADGTLDKTVAITANTSVSGIVSAINASGSSVKATLVNTGADYKIVLEGASGASNSFTATLPAVTGVPSNFSSGATTLQMDNVDGIWVGSTISGTGIPAGTTVTAINATTKQITLSQATTGSFSGSYTFSGLFPTTLQTAQDAAFTINDIPMTRSSNVVTDALDGVTLKLNSTSATAVQLGVSFDSTDIAASAKNFVAAYNTLMEFIGISTGPAIEDNDLSATLKGDTSVRGIKNTLRAKLTARSSSASGSATHWSVIGVSLDRAGVLQFDEAKFKSSFEKNPTDVVKALSNNASEPYLYSGSASGLAGDMAIAVFGLVRSTGTVADVEKSYQNKLSRLETEQTKLDKQIEAITARYERQFSALNAVLAEFKATSKRLDSTFNRNNND